MIPAAATVVCIFAYQAGFIADVPLSDVHTYDRAVIVPCHWTYEKAAAYWWSETESEQHREMPLPPKELPK